MSHEIYDDKQLEIYGRVNVLYRRSKSHTILSAFVQY
jgi:hypothetical protein